MTNEEFEKLLGRAQSKVKLSNNELSIKNFKPFEYVKEHPLGTWTYGLQSWSGTGYDYVNILKGAAIVKNLGDSYEFYSVSHEVDPSIYDQVMEKKYVQKARNYLLKKIQEAEIEFGREGNRHTISAKGSLKDVKDGTIVSDLHLLLHMARGIMHNIEHHAKQLK
jgi:hypothetical protein